MSKGTPGLTTAISNVAITSSLISPRKTSTFPMLSCIFDLSADTLPSKTATSYPCAIRSLAAFIPLLPAPITNALLLIINYLIYYSSDEEVDSKVVPSGTSIPPSPSDPDSEFPFSVVAVVSLGTPRYGSNSASISCVSS